MTWSKIAAKNCPAKAPMPTSPKKVEEEVKNDYWSDTKYDCNWQTVEQQVKNGYLKLGLEVPQSVYGRPGLLDFAK